MGGARRLGGTNRVWIIRVCEHQSGSSLLLPLLNGLRLLQTRPVLQGVWRVGGPRLNQQKHQQWCCLYWGLRSTSRLPVRTGIKKGRPVSNEGTSDKPPCVTVCFSFPGRCDPPSVYPSVFHPQTSYTSSRPVSGDWWVNLSQLENSLTVTALDGRPLGSGEVSQCT